MDPRKYKSGAVETPPEPLESPSEGYPSPGNPASGIPATVPGTYWHHMIAEEMRNVLILAGLTPDYEDLTQLAQSINVLISQNLLPVGTVLLRSGDVVPIGFFKRNGAEVSRATYSNHWAYVQTVSNLVDQAVKDASPEIYAGYYGTGDGSTTYTLPDDRGEFHRVWDDGRGVDAGREIGSFQLDQMQRITGSFVSRGSLNAGSVNPKQEGAISFDTPFSGVGSATGSSDTRVNFDSGNSPNARVSSTTAGQTQPRSIALMSIEKY